MAGVLTILDGPMGTELAARGVRMPAPMWSAWALGHQPDVVAEIHAEYAAAGATVHTANTFRTKRRNLGAGWAQAAERAVELARRAATRGHRVAGSIAPLEDCYRPDLSPSNPRPEHRELARALAAMGVDLLLCETFPHPDEALVAVEEAVATGLETWVALTAGPTGELLSPSALGRAAERCAQAGARACLVNCVAATLCGPYVQALGALGVHFGVYANAGDPRDAIGWSRAHEHAGASQYVELARGWVAAGASIVGGCCGTSPAHIRALSKAFGMRAP
jgi:S-methylmethionine-dependent homocysteine/selenocysteine methylase